MIRVLLVDDHKLVRTGIRLILEDTPDLRVAGEAESGETALALAGELKPDVVLMDVSMPGIGGLEATRRLLARDTKIKVIVVSVHAAEPYPLRLMEAGAHGYLTKDCAAEEIVTAIRQVQAGKRYITASIAQQLALAKVDANRGSPFEQLSQRETQVMLMVTSGQSPQAIAKKLHLSPKTVSTYRTRLFEKLGVENDVGLTRLALRYGVIEEKTGQRGA
ncbi:MAG: UvrY/SirA/GacA family response regulator transcription factor [Gammaproteobacteria bacterium]|nr:UvrY/SirA/GacA family response regulator transcription factor [Gammaproteobacteria bacterium]MBU6509771.1 UvrY/SirA/GacA family response regulator transcription factor [Gammaproteobacteria bacterium]MDE1983599.1 UvrY/SirA/GacA family response regulator transcription factor [Gammaproteobacteria bacterium]MDE2460117.1 UvrY/SirA/GacA family response regulator transcription factor [Gammaproteobacteria bacterium]